MLLKDCCAFQEGYVNPSQKVPAYFGGDIKWLRASDLNGGFVYDTERKLSNAGYKSAGKSATMFPVDSLAISKSGTIGVLGILKAEMCGNRAVINIRVNSEKADLHYIFYTLKNSTELLLGKTGGSIQRNLYVSALETVSLAHDKLTEQQGIAAILSSLDAKIDLNNRINAELEALAKTIYDYWFVQFDFPDAHGRPYKSSGGTMVWNDALKREIPAEWESVSLRHLVDCNANSYGANNLPDHIVYLDTGNLTENRLFGLEKYNTSKDEVPSRARRIASNGDVLYSTVRPNQNHHGIIKEVMDDLVVSTGFAVLTCTDKHLNGDFIYMFVRGDDIATKMRRIAESSRSSYPSIAPDDLLDLRLALPEDRTRLSKACKFFDQTFMKIWANEKENRELTQLRDWLLPLLMNGQVRVA